MRYLLALCCALLATTYGDATGRAAAFSAQAVSQSVSSESASESPSPASSSDDKDPDMCPVDSCCRHCDPDPEPYPPSPPPPPTTVVVDVSADHSHAILGHRGDDTIAFSVPAGSQLLAVVFSGDSSIGNSSFVADRPPNGAGPGSYTIRVHWWFNAFYHARYSIRVVVAGAVPSQISGSWRHDTTGANPYDFFTWWPYYSDMYFRTSW